MALDLVVNAPCIVTVTANPCVDETLFVDHLAFHDTNRIARIEWDAGGKGINVARLVAALGGKSVATGVVGGHSGSRVEAVLTRESVECAFVHLGVLTRTNYCVEDGSELPPTTFDAPGPTVRTVDLEALLSAVERLMPRAKWVMTGGSLPPGLPADAHAQVVRAARLHGVPVAVDADGESLRLALAAGPDFIKPNVHEAERLTKRRLEFPDRITACARALRDEMMVAGASSRAIAVISMGADGAVMACEAGLFRGSSPRVECRSSVGAGDSMVGGMLWCLATGESPEVALQWGLAAGAATARTRNVGVASRVEIEELLPAARVDVLPG